jgi:hypothetical protein
MWGRDKNFQVSMIFQLRNRENKISLSEIFYGSPFSVSLYSVNCKLLRQNIVFYMVNSK